MIQINYVLMINKNNDDVYHYIDKTNKKKYTSLNYNNNHLK